MTEERGTMRCPFCGEKTSVMDSRVDQHSNYVRRRRVCAGCKIRFTTVEVPTIVPQSAKALLRWASDTGKVRDG